MAFDIEITHSAERDLDRLRAFHRSKILGALEQYLCHAPTQVSHSRIKCLRLMGSPAYRLRVDNYRVYYDADEVEQIATVLRVLHKQDSFDYLRATGGDA